MAVQTQLANTGATLALYKRHLTQQLKEECSSELLMGLQQVSSILPKLIREQAEAAGKAMSGLWGVRRHLWLSQSMLPPEDQACLLRLPVELSAMFGPDTTEMLQQAQEARRCAREVSDLQHREALRLEISTLLTKKAIREVGQENQQAGFYSRYFLILKWWLRIPANISKGSILGPVLRRQLVSVDAPKSEDDEEKPQSSQLHQSQTEENREAEPLASSSTEQMKTEADGEDCGVSEPARNLDPASHLQPTSDGKTSDSSETETADSDDDWKETREPQSGLDSLFVSHKGSHTRKRPFSCVVCGKRYCLEEHLNRHMLIHTEKKMFNCRVCGKEFHHKRNIRVHMRNHTGEKPYSCSFCGKGFGQKAHLQTHMRVHTGEKPFSCSLCSKGFGLKAHLQTHMRGHTGEKPFSCSVCGKTFSQVGAVGRHMRSHTGEKPFSCPVCCKSFSEAGNLKRHVRLHHGEKPFRCSVCGKSFGDKGYLKAHMVSHTEEKPYSCSVCGRSFRQRSQVKKHKCVGESSSR
uniref:uncharacterized protein n=1 Tax=Centroberyx gerrardi TaxID=166262 RepID=UPI003AADF6AF